MNLGNLSSQDFRTLDDILLNVKTLLPTGPERTHVEMKSLKIIVDSK